MAENNPDESGAPLDRRAFLKRSTVASVGVGFGIDTRAVGVGEQEEPGVQYYDFVVPNEDVVDRSFVNKFVFLLDRRESTETVPFSDCFTRTESQAQNQFGRGAHTYDGVLIDASEQFQLFGDDDAVERLRRLLGGDANLPEALDENVGAVATTRVFAPAAIAPLPTNEGYRAVGGQHCEDEYVRLRVHELTDEVVSGSG